MTVQPQLQELSKIGKSEVVRCPTFDLLRLGTFFDQL